MRLISTPHTYSPGGLCEGPPSPEVSVVLWLASLIVILPSMADADGYLDQWRRASPRIAASAADPDPESGAFLKPWIRDPGWVKY
jgi:hypothetical protein